MEANNPSLGGNGGDLSPQLKTLLSLSFTCIKDLLQEEKELKSGFANLAKEVKGVENNEDLEKVRTQYRKLLAIFDEVEEKKQALVEKSSEKKKAVLSLVQEDEKSGFYPKLLAVFAQGTRHLCDKGDLLVESLQDIETRKFLYNEVKVTELVANLKNFFLGKLNEIETTVKEREELKTIIKALSDTLERFSSQSSTFGSHLREYADKISEAVTLEDIIVVKEAILRDTKKIVEESESFRIKVSSTEENLKKASLRIKRLEEEIEKVKEASAIDPLTGVFNRGYLNRKMQETVDVFSRYGGKISFILFDIDHFKRFNDTYGHQVGDKVLKTVASIVKQNTRKTDFLFRYGGEEFAVILPQTNIKDGKDVAELLRLGVEKHVFKYKGEPVSVTVSFGVTLFKQGDSLMKIIERADKALYQAKGNGRNRVEVMY